MKKPNYAYSVSYIDSELPEQASETRISSTYPLTKSDCEQILREQLEANLIVVEWLRVVELKRLV